MFVVFRTDASLEIGTGHVMRCLTLADTLRDRGARCRFVCREHSGNLLDLIRQRGHATHALPLADRNTNASAPSEPLLDHAAWLGTDWATDAQQTQAELGDSPIDWLIVDHYALDARWERILRPACKHLMVIDDLADRLHDCDLLLDQNLGRTTADYVGRVPVGCSILVGPRYALLRPEFAAMRPYSLARRAPPRIERLLINMGGVDKGNATGRVLEALKQSSLPDDCRITVIMGQHAPWLDQVRKLATQMPRETEVLVEVRDIARIMAGSDLAIGAAGSAAWERCCLGLPALILVLADNQQKVASALAESGCALLVEWGHEFDENLNKQLTAMQNMNRLRAMQVACGQITDGQGSLLLADAMKNIHE